MCLMPRRVGFAESKEFVAGSVVGDHPLDRDAEARAISDRGLQEGHCSAAHSS